ncbi:hypothetical protein, partial [Rhizobium fabae]
QTAQGVTVPRSSASQKSVLSMLGAASFMPPPVAGGETIITGKKSMAFRKIPRMGGEETAAHAWSVAP